MRLSRRDVVSAMGGVLAVSALPLGKLPAPTFVTDSRGKELLAAVRAGDLARVRALLALDAGLAKAKDETGRSAFVLAKCLGHEAVAQALVETGLELDGIEAVLAGDWPRFERLVAEDPDILRRAHAIGGTPLYAAALVGNLESSRLRSLGCDPDAAPAGGSGFTPARGAMEAVDPAWASIALTDLCGNGAAVNAKQRGGSSVLHGAVLRRAPALVRLAIRKGADPDAVDEAGETPLALARRIGWEEGVSLLAGAEKLPRDNRASRFALDANRAPVERPDLSEVPQELQNQITGSSHARLERLRELVGADRRLCFSISTDDELAIEACAHTGALEIIRFHLDRGAPLSLPTAVSLGDRETVLFWLERDPSLIHERGAHDFPLMWLAFLGGGGIEMAELLVQRGASIDQESMGTTALHFCARHGERDFARYFLERGAEPEAVGYKWSREGQTPLEIARIRDHPEMVALLTQAGARR